MELFFNLPISEFINYLRPIDIIVLRKVNKTLRNIFLKLKSPEELLEELLNSYFENVEYNLNISNSFIAGGFILSFLLNENWNSDIDIYTFKDHSVKFSFFYTDDDKRKKGRSSHIWNLFFNERKSKSIEENYIYLKYDDSYRHIPLENHRKGFIKSKDIKVDDMVTKIPVLDFIKNIFDLDFCKVAFNGKKIFIYDLESVIRRKSNYFTDLTIYNRIRKNPNYILFGNPKTIRNQEPITDEFLMNRMKKRTEKYRNRGFIIENMY
jgi:hypothetical protein